MTTLIKAELLKKVTAPVAFIFPLSNLLCAYYIKKNNNNWTLVILDIVQW